MSKHSVNLTGKRKLPQNQYDIGINTKLQNPVLSLSLHKDIKNKLSPNSIVSVYIVEDSYFEKIIFGKINNMNTCVNLPEGNWSNPKCTVNIVCDKSFIILYQSAGKKISQSKDKKSNQGIIDYFPKNLENKLWELSDLHDENKPVIYINKKIPNHTMFAQNNILLHSCIFPTIIKEVFKWIFTNDTNDETWIKDWFTWAETLYPHKKPPENIENSFSEDQEVWIEGIIEKFLHKKLNINQLIKHIEKESE